MEQNKPEKEHCGKCKNCPDCKKRKMLSNSIPISLAKESEKGIVTKINGDEETRRHLSELGFTTGSEVSAVCQINGDLILNVKGSRIALDRVIASKIMFCPSGMIV